ncbi:uncharacterized protein SETTUDRAFT_38901 [Exserohilum turcica Et28A]|uniref:Uncharacterized protein n=1 Tax=Exserohilum turcicum (strain 28A) TaxID=671987 RepID=R0ITW8_EXST2|nr:uncharacterized protein SETTUDRAFT_38901 [Exserohilum turcica Et28A]EOA88230.1 hypothetical protein SETTUDRAFT_38901 [Exserohilum turcica Et28A]
MANLTSKAGAKRKPVDEDDDDDELLQEIMSTTRPSKRDTSGLRKPPGAYNGPANVPSANTSLVRQSNTRAPPRSNGSGSQTGKRDPPKSSPMSAGSNPNGVQKPSHRRRSSGHPAIPARVSAGQGSHGRADHDQKVRRTFRQLVPADTKPNSSVLENERAQQNSRVVSSSRLLYSSVTYQDRERLPGNQQPTVVPRIPGHMDANQQLGPNYRRGLDDNSRGYTLLQDNRMVDMNALPIGQPSHLPATFPLPVTVYQDPRGQQRTTLQPGQLQNFGEAYSPGFQIQDPRLATASRPRLPPGSNGMAQAPAIRRRNQMVQVAYASFAPSPPVQRSMPPAPIMGAPQQNIQATWPVATATYQPGGFNNVAQPQPTLGQAGFGLQEDPFRSPVQPQNPFGSLAQIQDPSLMPAQVQGPSQVDNTSYLAISNRQYNDGDWQQAHRWSIAGTAMPLQNEAFQAPMPSGQQDFSSFLNNQASGFGENMPLFGGPAQPVQPAQPQANAEDELALWVNGFSPNPQASTGLENLDWLDPSELGSGKNRAQGQQYLGGNGI